MVQLRKYTTKEMYNMSFEKNPLFDMRKFECYMSLIFTVILTLIVYFHVITNSNIEFITSNAKNIILNATFGFLGMLGFIISGLAIISGTIGHKVTKNLIRENKFKSLITILFSFNYLGYVIGFLIVLFISCYFILSIRTPFLEYIFLVFTAVASYGLFFAVFYAVSLLKTCLDIFVINYIYSDERIDSSIAKELEFHRIKIDALTKVMFDKKLIDKNSYIAQLKERVNLDVSDEKMKNDLLNEISRYYSEN